MLNAVAFFYYSGLINDTIGETTYGGLCMANEEKSAVDQRLQNAVYGTPKINPDEQRRYLGTFRNFLNPYYFPFLSSGVHQRTGLRKAKLLLQPITR